MPFYEPNVLVNKLIYYVEAIFWLNKKKTKKYLRIHLKRYISAQNTIQFDQRDTNEIKKNENFNLFL